MCYIYFFETHGLKACIDTTLDDGSFGRLINHSKKNKNLIPKVVDVQGRPHVIFFASNDIQPLEELFYDYMDTYKPTKEESFANPWLLQ